MHIHTPTHAHSHAHAHAHVHVHARTCRNFIKLRFSNGDSKDVEKMPALVEGTFSILIPLPLPLLLAAEEGREEVAK